jgi:hypothetical protein
MNDLIARQTSVLPAVESDEALLSMWQNRKAKLTREAYDAKLAPCSHPLASRYARLHLPFWLQHECSTLVLLLVRVVG